VSNSINIVGGLLWFSDSMLLVLNHNVIIM